MKIIRLSFIIPLIGLFLSFYVICNNNDKMDIVSYGILIAIIHGLEIGIFFGYYF